MRAWPGSPYPLGATWDGEGANFALFSQHAEAVELCLFDEADVHEQRVRLRERNDAVWHVYLPDVRPGQLYGYRVYGPYAPDIGQRFNPHKLLLDPYARAITGPVLWDDAVYGYRIGQADDLSFNHLDSAAYMPKCVVVDTAFTWGDDRPPQTPWTRTVIYECHVKGMTARRPGVPAALRGSYLGLSSESVLEHLQRLGITAVQLLPVQHSLTPHHLAERGLTNYWGYDPVGYFAPDPRYASSGLGSQVTEFKSMVKAFHRAGIEVIIDVVYNHTVEGNHLGPTLSFRGIDNESYYRLEPGAARFYVDHTGCGNSLNVAHPRVAQMILDSMRYWVTDMHVDGFRFDLAPVLGRQDGQFNPTAAFFAMLQQDPILSRVKLIAEPWDLGPDGDQSGNFPPGWAEWNGRYRDAVRRFWRGDEGTVSELASRLSGSSDLFQGSGRGPYASVNFVTCHDGFTLEDLVSYNVKHNEPNLESNLDGTDANFSRNWGVEGPAESVRIINVRNRIKRNMLATLAFSQGVPMLSHGDEVGRTQRGINNAYCQDNELTWVDWEPDEHRRELLQFSRHIFRIRSSNPVFRRRRFFAGDPISPRGAKDVSWIRPDGAEMTEADWHNSRNRVLGMLIHGEASDEVDERGRPNRGETLLLLLNGGAQSRFFQLPEMPRPGSWHELVNTARPGTRMVRGGGLHLVSHSLILLHYGR